jgi:plastocyanin
VFLFGAMACLLLLPGSELAAQTGTGGIRGTIVVPGADEFADELLRERSLTRYEMPLHSSNEPVQPYSISEKAVVYIESVPRPPDGYEIPTVHPKLNQSQMLFRPLVLPILVGTTVDFPNNDNLFHNVFSYSQPREFDLGRYPRGQQRSVRFDRTGTVSVFCDIHSFMYATILALDNPYFAVPDESGAYSIGNVPPGTYKLVFWYGRKKATEKQVTVKENTYTVVNFEY